jgi:hypothetical protein
MSYNPLSELNRQRLDVLDVLRRDVDVWLSTPSAIKRTQTLLAKRAGISNQMLSDVLAGNRGLSADTYDKLVAALKFSGATITHYSTMGRVGDGDTPLDVEDARERLTNLQAEKRQTEFENRQNRTNLI